VEGEGFSKKLYLRLKAETGWLCKFIKVYRCHI
jgi:hypothetical protein